LFICGGVFGDVLDKIDVDNPCFLLYNFCLEDWAKYEITVIMDEPPY